MKPIKPHDSMRGYFAYHLYEEMEANDDIYVLVGDLGFGMFDAIRTDFPNRFINCGASEQTMMGMAVGLAQSGKIPFVYSITPFLLYRPFETIRNYMNAEKANVKLIGSGRDKDYEHDGISHWADDVPNILSTLENISQYYPETKDQIKVLLHEILKEHSPSFLSLKR